MNKNDYGLSFLKLEFSNTSQINHLNNLIVINNNFL